MPGYTRDGVVVLIDTEAMPGTYQEPLTVLPMEKGGDLWEPKVDTDENDPLSAHHGSKETVVIADFAGVETDITIKVPTDHTLIAPLLAMCGLVGTAFAGGTSFAYSSTSKSTASLKQIGLREHTAVYGARASLDLTLEVGKAAEMSMKMMSQLYEAVSVDAADPDTVLPSVPSFEKVYMTKNCTAYLVNGQEAHFTKVDFTLGAEVKQPKDTCSGACYTMDTKPEITVSMVADPDNAGAFADLKSGTEFNFVIPLYSVDGTKQWELIAPKCVVISQKKPKKDGLINIERTLECRKVDGDDNFELRKYHA